MENKKEKIVTIGGGSGSYTLLSGLKRYPVEISAIVSMADNGGSTGRLRDELGVLPPGDVRQCLVALSEADDSVRNLFNYRYQNGGLNGHNFGNLFLSALEKMTGSFRDALREAEKILNVGGKVIPVTLKNTNLVAKMKNGEIIFGQNEINGNDMSGLDYLLLDPIAEANEEAIEAISEADKIIINPGDFYSSIIPNFLVAGISQAIIDSKAKKIFVCNLMNKKNHTNDFCVKDYIDILHSYIGQEVIGCIIYNKQKPDRELLEKYSEEGDNMVKLGGFADNFKINCVEKDLLSKSLYRQQPGDLIKRTLIRHDSLKLAKAICEL